MGVLKRGPGALNGPGRLAAIEPGIVSAKRTVIGRHSGAPAGTIQDVYTCPAGRRVMVKRVVIGNSTSGNDYAVSLFVRRGSDLAVASRTVYRDSSVEFDVALILEAGQSIGVQHSAPTNILHTTAWGHHVDSSVINSRVVDNFGIGAIAVCQDNVPGATSPPRVHTMHVYSDTAGPKWVRARIDGLPFWQTLLGAGESVSLPGIVVPAASSFDVHVPGGVGTWVLADVSVRGEA